MIQVFFLCSLTYSFCSTTRTITCGSYSVIDCSFFGFSTPNSGAVLFFESGLFIKIQRCDFSLCICNYKGGAVYIETSDYCEMTQICGSLCRSGSDGLSGQFLYIYNGENGKYSNIVAQKCWNTTSYGDDAFCICRSQNICVSHCNLSRNYGHSAETAAFHAYLDRNVTFSYSNVINNVGSRAFGVYLESGSSHSVHHLNIVGNTVSSSLIYIKTPIQLEYCYIHSNSFSVGSSITLLHSVDSSHSILINHCSFHIESTKQQQIINHTHLFVFFFLLK